MESADAGVQLLKERYNLHKIPVVKAAADRTQAETGEKISQNPVDQITNYLGVFDEMLDREDPVRREFGIHTLKGILHTKFVIKPEEVPESYFDNQKRLAREQGHGDMQIDEAQRQQLTKVIIADQVSSLDQWVDYLGSSDAPYSDGFKYYILRSILSMGAYDKEKHSFSRRNKETTSPFPDLNREALAVAIDVVDKRITNASDFARIGEQVRQTRNKIKSLSGEVRKGNTSVEADLESYQALLQALRKEEDMLLGIGNVFDPKEGETPDQKKTRLNERNQLHYDIEKANFAQLYAWAIENVTPASIENLKTIQGKWVKYDKGSDHLPLVRSLQGHGTGWCTAGESTAIAQLQEGDFYVYYSQDENGNSTVPRAAIRMQDGKIAEVRGIASQQNLDGNIVPVVDEKLIEFPDGEAYKKKVSDMKRLTNIEVKVKENEALTREDLRFLYELDFPIQGFGYRKDPRIGKVIHTRDKRKDLAYALDADESMISLTKEEALVGGIVFHYGDLYLAFLESAEGLTLPQSVGGDLYLDSLTSAEGLTLPQSVGGDLYLDSLTSAEGLTFPQIIRGSITLGSLKSAEKQILRDKYPHFYID